MKNVQEKFKKYPGCKSSGVKWVGDVPEHWDVKRLGTHFQERRTKVSDKDFAPLSVTKQGILPQLANAAKSNDGDNRKLVKEGDFVINSRSDRKGSSGIANENGSVSLINIVMKPKNFERGYTNYLLKGYSFIEEYYRNGHGIVADLWTTRYDEMKNIKIPIPPLAEQTSIANFLDEKTTLIDQAIAQKEKLIELLKERKQIIIQNAVTKGLDATVKLKDSGVEWIGEIPEHWEVKKIKHVTSKIGSGITPSGGGTTYLDEGGIPLLRSQNIHFGRIDFSDVARISEKVHNSMSNSHVRQGDVLLNITGGSIGRCHYVETNDALNVNQHVCIVRPKAINTVFLNYILASEIGQGQIWFFQQGGGREGLNFQALKNFFIPFPEIEEQKKIISFIEIQSSKFDKAITLQQTQIEKLKEYKATLIDSAVTGKIKVC